MKKEYVVLGILWGMTLLFSFQNGQKLDEILAGQVSSPGAPETVEVDLEPLPESDEVVELHEGSKPPARPTKPAPV